MVFVQIWKCQSGKQSVLESKNPRPSSSNKKYDHEDDSSILTGLRVKQPDEPSGTFHSLFQLLNADVEEQRPSRRGAARRRGSRGRRRRRRASPLLRAGLQHLRPGMTGYLARCTRFHTLDSHGGGGGGDHTRRVPALRRRVP